jgi:hypothetical protein
MYNTQTGIINFTFHLLKDQPVDGHRIGPKHVAGVISLHNLIKYKVVYDCIMYILYYILGRSGVCFREFQFPPVTIIPPKIHSSLQLQDTFIRKTSRKKLDTFR